MWPWRSWHQTARPPRSSPFWPSTGAWQSTAPGSYAAFARLSTVKDSEEVPRAKDMIRELVEGQHAVVRTARALLEVAERVGDQASADVATQRLQIHEKTAWMLRSLLEE